MVAAHERVGGGFAPQFSINNSSKASTVVAVEAAQDADVAQTDREPALLGMAQRAEYHTDTRKHDALAAAGRCSCPAYSLSSGCLMLLFSSNP